MASASALGGPSLARWSRESQFGFAKSATSIVDTDARCQGRVDFRPLFVELFVALAPHKLARIALLVRFGYVGHRFHGLQPQGPLLATAGDALRARLHDAAGEPARGLNFAARTDAGVHALRNLATCYWPVLDDVDGMLARLATPRDDGLVDVEGLRVPPTVHARGTSRGKRYRSLVEDNSVNASERSAFVWPVAPPLDVDAMRTAAAFLVGTHDFSSLRGSKCSAATPVKSIVSLRIGGPFLVDEGPARRFVFEISGDAFLRHMIRNLVGLLVEVGAGWRDAHTMPNVLDARVRSAAGLMAPSGGLTLVAVGCAWPEDGSGLLPELRGFRMDAPDDTLDVTQGPALG